MVDQDRRNVLRGIAAALTGEAVLGGVIETEAPKYLENDDRCSQVYSSELSKPVVNTTGNVTGAEPSSFAQPRDQRSYSVSATNMGEQYNMCVDIE